MFVGCALILLIGVGPWAYVLRLRRQADRHWRHATLTCPLCDGCGWGTMIEQGCPLCGGVGDLVAAPTQGGEQ